MYKFNKFTLEKTRMNLSLSIDVEEWFQVENLRSTINKANWYNFELRVEKNCQKILTILEKNQVKATFFILGWICERLPDLAREICLKGHEIGSHGFDHEPVYKLSKQKFRDDLLRSKEVLEKHSGQKIIGFRAPTFSMTDWALEIIKEENFIYDSSYQPYRSIKDFSLKIKKEIKKNIIELDNGLFEVLLSSKRIAGIPIPWSGGGYFRLIPYTIFKKGIKEILKEKKSYCFFIHPWEFDPDQPKVNAPFIKKFRHYHALSQTEAKFRSLLNDFKFTSIREVLKSYDSIE